MQKAMELSSINAEYKPIAEAIKEQIDNLNELVANKIYEEAINKDDILKIAYESISKALPEVNTFLDEHVNSSFPDLNESLEDIFYLCHRIKYDLPPNAIEKSSPFDPKVPGIREIINAGWFYKITYLSEKTTSENYKEYLNRLDLLNRLIFKALELSDFSNYYKKAMKIEE
jgi:hypothetical protein